MVLYSDRQVDQWNRTEDPETNTHTYHHLIFDKGAETIQWEKIAFSTNCTGLSVVSMQKNANRSILISLYKAQVQVGQGPPYKTRNTETNRKESGEEP